MNFSIDNTKIRDFTWEEGLLNHVKQLILIFHRGSVTTRFANSSGSGQWKLEFRYKLTSSNRILFYIHFSCANKEQSIPDLKKGKKKKKGEGEGRVGDSSPRLLVASDRALLGPRRRWKCQVGSQIYPPLFILVFFFWAKYFFGNQQ